MAEADAIELIEKLDRFARLRNALREIARETGHWAGIPMPLDGQPLVVEPRFPTAKIFEKAPTPEDKEEAEYEITNSFYSAHRRCQILVGRHKPTGKVTWGIEPRIHHAAQLLQTLGASYAWGIDQERRAIDTLGTLVHHHTFKMYLLTGMFLESSPRSGLMYVFRRLRPTLVLNMKGKDVRVLAALCMHPIGYYAGSWAGAMCPTDDVIAHLMLMRGDEHRFWKNSNQHPPTAPEAGI